ncbi:MAG: hypothetical protein L6R40_007671 [Gallowayella cf. fulva]|nr:MAG: hypothetical protein L6R40_007671 [Xanthomendoza cf. fulva]
MPPAELEPFLQNWLFFVLLHEVLGDLYRHEEYVTTSLDGEVEKLMVTTTDLLCRLEDWEVKIQQDKASLTDVYKHIAQCLDLTYACLIVEYPAFDDFLKFHLASAAEILGYAANKACDSIASGQLTRHSGSLPLLRIKEEADFDIISIEVVASTDSTAYEALSHVWADGLGNPAATALPRFQISRLKALIDNLDFEYVDIAIASGRPQDTPEMLLWCDTLCCPVAPEEAKNMAPREMYRMYDKAAVVLVLDRSLISPRVGGMHVDEACLRIATSRWMTRLWTLQEGALPAKNFKLWFQFTKTALPVATLYEYLYKIMRADIRRRGIVGSVLARFHTFMPLFDKATTEDRGAKLEDIMRGLLYRSVTVPSDEPLIIATLLASDLDPILASEPAERMNTLWRTLAAAARVENLATALTESHDPAYQEALQSLYLESQSLSRSPFAIEALAASGNSVDERGSDRLREHIERIYRGLYLHIEEYSPGSKKWCVD